MDLQNVATQKLAEALEVYEKEMGLEDLSDILAMSLVACTLRLDQGDTVSYPIETDFASGSVVVTLVSKN